MFALGLLDSVSAVNVDRIMDQQVNVSWNPPFSLDVTGVAIPIFYDLKAVQGSQQIFSRTDISNPYILVNISDLNCVPEELITLTITPINEVGRGEALQTDLPCYTSGQSSFNFSKL